MLTINTLFQQELVKLIDSQIEHLKENLTTIHKTEGFDFAAYKHMVGKIEGLRLALELCMDADRITNGTV